MSNVKSAWRNVAFGAITAISLSVPIMSVAQAEPQAWHRAMNCPTPDPLLINRENVNGQPALQNFTLPEWSPDYSGANGG